MDPSYHIFLLKGKKVERSEYVASREDSLLMIIDFQQAMLKAIDSWETIAGKVKQLIRSASALNIPILFTEQYKQGLGGTLSELIKEIKSPQVFQKEHFSACLEEDFISTVQSFDRKKIMVVGMETHVCVLQTCLDLIKAGFQVHLVADAVASRVEENRDIAINIMRQAGAVISSTEIIIFQWACRANTDEFRKILPIVK
jgi:nicotinamidase-related amidase